MTEKEVLDIVRDNLSIFIDTKMSGCPGEPDHKVLVVMIGEDVVCEETL